MKRYLSVAAALALAAACSDRSALTPPTGPLQQISDATHSGGNPDFFFLSPLVPNASSDPRFDAGAFNPHLSPTVQVCRWTTSCAQVVASFTMTSGLGSEVIRVNTTDQSYAVNWHTDLSNLDPAATYRIEVNAGGKELGFADVDVVSSGRDLKNVQTGEYIGLVDGRTLPIKFRIENGALCDPPGSRPCGSGTVDLASGGAVVVPGTGDRIDIPPQTSGGLATFTIQYCQGVAVDVPRFGACLDITSDPPNLSFSPRAVVSMCSLLPPGLTEAQEHLVVMYRQHGDQITALPNVPDHCGTIIGAAAAPPRNLAEAGWRLVQRAVAAVLGPSRLFASAPVLHLGAGGETPGESNFQLGLPAQMAALPNTQGQTAAPGDTVPYPPGVIVTDTAGGPVTGAVIHFLVTQGNGNVTPESVVTDTSGVAQVTNWTLGNPGANQLRAWAIGIRGPADSFPITPDTLSIAADTGQVFFNATATAPCDTIFLATFTADTANLPPGPPEVGSWTLFQSAGTIRVRSAEGNLANQPVEMDQTAGPTGGVDLIGTVAGAPPTSGVWRASWQSLISSPDTSVFFIPIVLRDASGLILASLEYRPGGLLTYNAAGNTVVGYTWSVNVAQSFSIVVDLDSNRTSLFINGSAVAGFQNVPFVQAAANLDRIAVETGGVDAQRMAWDNISITCASPVGGIGIDSVNMSTTSLGIGGPNVGYTITYTNGTTGTLSGVVVQTYVDQGSVTHAAGGIVALCGAGNGILPPGTCVESFTIGASYADGGPGLFVPGAASARFQLLQGSSVLATFTVPVTLF